MMKLTNLSTYGAELHDNNKPHAAAARDRKALTVITQETLLHVWEGYIEACSDKTIAAMKVDDDEVYRMMLKVEFDACDDFDTYDPLGGIDTDGNARCEEPTTESIASKRVVSNQTGDNHENKAKEAVGDSTHRGDGQLRGPSSGSGAMCDESLDIEVDMQERFANYGWHDRRQVPDPDLQVTP